MPDQTAAEVLAQIREWADRERRGSLHDHAMVALLWRVLLGDDTLTREELEPLWGEVENERMRLENTGRIARGRKKAALRAEGEGP